MSNKANAPKPDPAARGEKCENVCPSASFDEPAFGGVTPPAARGVNEWLDVTWARKIAAAIDVTPEGVRCGEAGKLRSALPPLVLASDFEKLARVLLSSDEAQRELERAHWRDEITKIRDLCGEDSCQWGEGSVDRVRGVIKERDTLRARVAELEGELEKAQFSARQFCGAHIGVPQNGCPVCTLEARPQPSVPNAGEALTDAWIEELRQTINECDENDSHAWGNKGADERRARSNGEIRAKLLELRPPPARLRMPTKAEEVELFAGLKAGKCDIVLAFLRTLGAEIMESGATPAPAREPEPVDVDELARTLMRVSQEYASAHVDAALKFVRATEARRRVEGEEAGK